MNTDGPRHLLRAGGGAGAAAPGCRQGGRGRRGQRKLVDRDLLLLVVVEQSVYDTILRRETHVVGWR